MRWVFSHSFVNTFLSTVHLSTIQILNKVIWLWTSSCVNFLLHAKETKPSCHILHDLDVTSLKEVSEGRRETELMHLLKAGWRFKRSVYLPLPPLLVVNVRTLSFRLVWTTKTGMNWGKMRGWGEVNKAGIDGALNYWPRIISVFLFFWFLFLLFLCCLVFYW